MYNYRDKSIRGAVLANDVQQWRELIEQLPYVYNAEFLVDENDIITEIHILADQARPPKQIMRDVQSALAAKFKIKLDHKIISIAQIPSEGINMYKQRPRLKYMGMSLSFSNSECKISVTLENNGEKFSGTDTCDLNRSNRYRAIATATAKAVNSYLKEKANVVLKDVRATEIDGYAVIIVSVIFYHAGQTEVLLGSCIEKDDSGPAAIRSTLDAVNRRIMII